MHNASLFTEYTYYSLIVGSSRYEDYDSELRVTLGISCEAPIRLASSASSPCWAAPLAS